MNQLEISLDKVFVSFAQFMTHKSLWLYLARRQLVASKKHLTANIRFLGWILMKRNLSYVKSGLWGLRAGRHDPLKNSRRNGRRQKLIWQEFTPSKAHAASEEGWMIRLWWVERDLQIFRIENFCFWFYLNSIAFIWAISFSLKSEDQQKLSKTLQTPTLSLNPIAA